MCITYHSRDHSVSEILEKVVTGFEERPGVQEQVSNYDNTVKSSLEGGSELHLGNEPSLRFHLYATSQGLVPKN